MGVVLVWRGELAGGVLLVETGADQAARTAAAMTSAGPTPRILSDDDLDGTVVEGRVSGRTVSRMCPTGFVSLRPPTFDGLFGPG